MKSFRVIASEWHGGQSSPLYAYSCTGTILPGLIDDIEYCLSIAKEEEKSELRSLLAEVSE